MVEMPGNWGSLLGIKNMNGQKACRKPLSSHFSTDLQGVLGLIGDAELAACPTTVAHQQAQHVRLAPSTPAALHALLLPLP